MSNCIFCDIINGVIDTDFIYEDELVVAIMDIDPINDGHVLIIPRKHKLDLDELTEEEMNRMMKVSNLILRVLKKLFKPDGYSMMQNGGAFNDIGHYHMHVFPRYKNDGFGWTYGEHKQQPVQDMANMIRHELI